MVDEHSITIDEELEPLRLVSARKHKLSGHVSQIILNADNTKQTQVSCIVAEEQRHVAMLDDVGGACNEGVKVECLVAKD